MTKLEIKAAETCRYDLVALGEVMLRFDPGEGRVRTARQFRVWEGGGEYNVARGLRRCFGMRTALVSALVDNEVGRLLEDLILQGGVDMSFVRWIPFDGVGRQARNGLNFTERGFGVRGALGCSDRGHTAAAQLKPDDIDWASLFAEHGVRWLHTGGIFAALSETTPEVVLEAITIARQHGTLVSYDLNYRPSLWEASGGPRRAREINRDIAPHVDVLVGNEEDFDLSLGLSDAGRGPHSGERPIAEYRRLLQRAADSYPNLKAVAVTLRTVHTATINDWNALCRCNGTTYEAMPRANLEILDRVGGGDAFMSGLIFGFLTTGDAQKAVQYGAAHGALAMTTPGDTSMMSLSDVERLMAGGGARVVR
ncbi:MAG: sugar kinase [Phycisphaerales bacterium]|nr:MAG: sugar kinase [Phycisphaerales bacterium]